MQSTKLATGLLISALLIVGCKSKDAASPDNGEPENGGSNGTGAGSGAVCGSRGLPPCAEAELCEFPADSQCGALDKGGVCKTRPEVCAEIFDPVCGCDGATYSSACHAALKGQSVAKQGPCEGSGQ